MKKILLFIIPIGFSLNIFSQNNSFSLGMELRPKALIDIGYKCPKTIYETPLTYILQRSRINASLKSNKLKTYISVQDIRIWGDENNFTKSGVFGNSESVSIHQAWFLLNPAKNISVKIGRQLFSYDDQRIISSRNWNDYQVSYDAVLFQVIDTINKLDIGLNWNSETSKSLYFPEEKFKTFDFIRYERQIHDFNFSSIALLTGNTINDSSKYIYLRGTYSLNLNYKKNGFKLNSSVYYQNNLNNKGQNLNPPSERTSAYCFSIFANKNIFQEKAFIGIGLDYLSGNDGTNSNNTYQNTNHRFDILYGKRHGYYGYMDYFSTSPEEGLEDYMLKTGYKFSKKISLNADYHYFRLAENKFDLEDPTIKLNKNLGHEFDFTLKWEIIDEASLQAGYSFYLMSNSLKQIKNVHNKELRFPQFAYILIKINSKFLFN